MGNRERLTAFLAIFFHVKNTLGIMENGIITEVLVFYGDSAKLPFSFSRDFSRGQIAFQTLTAFDTLISNNLKDTDYIRFIIEGWNETRISFLLEKISAWQTQRFLKTPIFLIQFSQPITNLSLRLTTILDNIHTLNFPIDRGLYILQPSFSHQSVDCLEIFSIKEKISVIQLPRKTFDHYVFLSNPAMRTDFHQAAIIGAGIDAHGYEMATDFDDDNSTETRFAGGFEVEFYRVLRDALNFREVALKGPGFVREGPGGTLTGTATSINKGDADICISSTEFLEYRISGPDGLSYLLPTFRIEMEAYFKQPPPNSIRDVFISAFSLELWILLFALWVIICSVMSLAYLIYSKDNWTRFPLSWNDQIMSKETWLWAPGVMCQQGWHITPEYIGTRTIFIVGWLAGFFCYLAFSAQLVSILSVEVIPIKSFEDLSRGGFFLYSDAHIPSSKYFVQGLEKRGVIPTFPEKVREVDIEETFFQIMETESAMVSISDSIFPIIEKMGVNEKVICDSLSSVKIREARSVVMSMFVKKSSPLRGVFNLKILTMLERGVNNRILQIYFVKTSVRCLPKGKGTPPITSRDLFTAYAILFGGFVLAPIVMVLEYLFRKIVLSPSIQNVRRKIMLNYK